MSVSSSKTTSFQRVETAYIFGAGSAGVSALKFLKNQCQILGFVDNDLQKQGAKIEGLEVFPPAMLLASEAYVYIASEYFEQIYSQLIALGVEEKRLLTTPAMYLKPACLEGETARLGLEILECLCRELEQAQLDYHIDAGTLLGMIRDGELIPWDDDLDVALNANDVNAFDDKLANLKKSLCHVTATTWQVEKHIAENGFGNVPQGSVRSFKLYSDCDRDIPSVDIFIKYRNSEFSDYCLASRGIRMPAHLSAATRVRQIKQRNFRVPYDAEGYLEYHYGKDWEIPNPHWSLSELENTKLF